MKILLHMPHTSLKVPRFFFKGLKISKEEFRKYNLEMTDLGIDELLKDYKYTKVKAKYSRLFLDVERFKDDELEIMSKVGEGVVYTHTYDAKLFHEHNLKYKKKVLKYYDKYHNKLDRVAKRLLKKDDELLIIDCHSFSDKMASHFFKPPFPDVCIGVEEGYYDKEILDSLIKEITKFGYSYEINYPYKGSLVPNIIYDKKIKYKKVVSIMLEINKRIYL